ncbi:MAG: hypothetical protein SGJ19_03510 [Planctomycetia bacterium]|nr:hypothetical protein [Planctomycetia bacterium]
MTVVVRYGYKTLPAMMSDLLIAGQAPWERIGPMLPTTDDAWRTFTGARIKVPLGLRQKIALVSDNLVIGWSGFEIDAMNDISDIIDLNYVAPLNRSTFSAHLNRHPSKLQMVGFIQDDDGIVGFQTDGAVTFNTPILDQVAIIGTGTDPFTEAFMRDLRPTRSTVGIPEEAIGIGLNVFDEFIFHELLNQYPLRQRFGGGYEFVRGVNGRFEKIADITYCLWMVNFGSDGKARIAHLDRVLHFLYREDVLVIECAVFPRGEGKLNFRRFFVPPAHRDVRPHEIDRGFITLNSRILRHSCLVTQGKRVLGTTGAVRFHTPEEDLDIQFVETPGFVETKVRDGFVEELEEMVNRQCRYMLG